MWLFALFVAVPLIEIALFIQVGGVIGLWWTLTVVVVTALVGTALVRTQGLRAMADLQSSFNRLSNPTEPLAHGAMILFSGALLLTPGFFTDVVGFALLIPAVRRAVMRYIASRVRVQSFTMGTQETYYPPASEDILDGEFTDVTPGQHPTHPGVKGPSGWTKH